MKLKTTINGKQSTVIGTPAEVAEFLEVARKKAIRRAVDALPSYKPHEPQAKKLHEGERVVPKPTSITIHHTGDDGKVAPNNTIHVKDAFKPKFNAISQTREEIVKEAIADVAELLGRSFSEHECNVPAGAWFNSEGGKHTVTNEVLFNVNKAKREVFAIIRYNSGSRRTKATGIARCAPSDVFNEHVGKAIALRRALGLEVPTKYYEVGDKPPEGKRVGDVVEFSEGDVLYRTELVGGYGNAGHPRSGKTGVYSFNARVAKVIDDSARYVAPPTPAAKVVYVD